MAKASGSSVSIAANEAYATDRCNEQGRRQEFAAVLDEIEPGGRHGAVRREEQSVAQSFFIGDQIQEKPGQQHAAEDADGDAQHQRQRKAADRPDAAMKRMITAVNTDALESRIVTKQFGLSARPGLCHVAGPLH